MHFPSVYNWLSVRPLHITVGINMTFFLIACLLYTHIHESFGDSKPKIKLITLKFPNFGDFADWKYWKCPQQLEYGVLSFIHGAYCGNVSELCLLLYGYVKRHVIHSIPALITAIKKQKAGIYVYANQHCS